MKKCSSVGICGIGIHLFRPPGDLSDPTKILLTIRRGVINTKFVGLNLPFTHFLQTDHIMITLVIIKAEFLT